jgi:hypothetical protein
MPNIQFENVRFVLHTSVDYVCDQGAGIGIVVTAHSDTSGKLNPIGKAQQRGVIFKNCKSADRAQVLAIHIAFASVETLYKRTLAKEGVGRPQKVTVHIESASVAEAVNQYFKTGVDALEKNGGLQDRDVICKAVKSIVQMHRDGIEFELVAYSAKDRYPCRMRARILAWRKRTHHSYKEHRRALEAKEQSTGEGSLHGLMAAFDTLQVSEFHQGATMSSVGNDGRATRDPVLESSDSVRRSPEVNGGWAMGSPKSIGDIEMS